MATNEFKPFATGAGANVMSQADWEALPALITGFQAGKASSAQVNKAIRQASFVAAALAQFIANQSGNDVHDDGDVTTLVASLLSAINKTSQPLDATLTALAALATGANKLPYFTGPDAASQTDLTQVGRDIIGKTDIASVLSYLGLGTAAKKDVGTGTGQIPDMSSFSLARISASSGYQKLPSGLIFQWTIGPSTTIETLTTITLPIPFPTAMMAGMVSTNANSGNTSDIMYQTVSSTASSITLQSQIFTTLAGAGSVSPVVFAIGY
ncbi:phage tail protein [Cedecea sp. P7760]|uniref:gp53-like domain-containing protein n=1 Tax=Cedecea sp. P7760 TaxID=2726983 RepID=UPI0015A4ADA9|nr:phage tail protein [Cedecea sp. P7760]NWC62910.1 phage tail protein [Cedecea sp. P7760]